ncbi:DUF4139 domain-containing protein [Flavobacterium sp. DG1-102-2]|uniref:DUF4139 domain-containing protein n=1 Tax=Flavobacterium sp. DG1-102-2 TaxID=3081663 RepID=UPI002948F249|nr:DUF4139 domain-containing protein [Flavobacterium sp. DG1-102-2]MDV6167567.1 DUF4139 domain-containing protein [Flavobacterium sp. DG1-102-2]
MKKISLLLFLVSAVAVAQKPVFTTAKVKAATVYFNAAEITQSASVTLPSGTSELVIKNVANYLNENTVQIGAPANVTVLSVQFTRDYISEYEPDETSPPIKKVRDSIKLVEKELAVVVNQKTSEQKTLELLDKNNQVYGQQSGLSVAELMKMVDYYKTKRTETANAINAFYAKEQKLNEKLANLKSRLEINASKEEKSSLGKLVLQVMSDVPQSTNLDITYLTGNASWTPFYDLRADNTTTPINMLYKAQVIQQTGVDWKKVKLTLSSGMPNQSSYAPELSAWFLSLADNFKYKDTIIQAKPNANFIQTLQGQVPGLEISTGEMSLDKSNISNYTTITEHQMNISFDIDLPYDVLSNGKQHSVTLKEIKLPATYRHYAVPKLEQDAFLLAEIDDYSKYNLLKGEANIIFEGMYIGKTYINPSQTTDTLSLSMGRDKKISIEREKVAEKSGSKFLSSGREQTFTYDIIIRNNKKEAAKISVKDQYPISTDKEIETTLLQSDGAKVDQESGLLTWELNLKPGESKKLRLSYRVKHPKNRNVDNL